MKLDRVSDLGLHFVVGIFGAKLTEQEEKLLRELNPAGIILFKHNIDREAGVDWPKRLAVLISQCRNCIERKTFFISIDHEGGKVHRLPAPITHFPTASHYAPNAIMVGATMGRELRDLGINLSYSPVLDVNSETRNPVIGGRAFSSDPAAVITHAREFLRALEAEGVVGCGKHFPGHGSTTADSHLELPVVAASREELSARELKPFQALIDSGIRMLMTAHVVYSALDPAMPATFSRTIVTGLLRKELGFSGVVISDDLNMKALNAVAVQKRGLECLKAGVDLLLVGNTSPEVPLVVAAQMAETILAATKKRELDVALLQASQKRVNTLLGELESLQLASK